MSCYRNWPRYGLRWSGLCCHSQHSTSMAGRATAGPTRAVPGVAAQTSTAQTVWVVNFYSTTKVKQCRKQLVCPVSTLLPCVIYIIAITQSLCFRGLHVHDSHLPRMRSLQIIWVRVGTLAHAQRPSSSSRPSCPRMAEKLVFWTCGTTCNRISTHFEETTDAKDGCVV